MEIKGLSALLKISLRIEHVILCSLCFWTLMPIYLVQCRHHETSNLQLHQLDQQFPQVDSNEGENSFDFKYTRRNNFLAWLSCQLFLVTYNIIKW